MELIPHLHTESGWEIVETAFEPSKVVVSGSNFMIGNGYMGYRGTFESWGKGEYAACIVTDTWDLAKGSSLTELCNVPNGLYTDLLFEGESLEPATGNLSDYSHRLDLRVGLNEREFSWTGGKGQKARVLSRKFASAAQPHLLVLQMKVKVETAGAFVIRTGIDGDVWSIGGEHFSSYSSRESEAGLSMDLVTGERGTRITVAEGMQLSGSTARRSTLEKGDRHIWRQLDFQLQAGDEIHLEKVVSITHDNRVESPSEQGDREVAEALAQGFDNLLEAHRKPWQHFWSRSDIRVEGDAEAQLLMRFNLYQAYIATPTHANLPVGARGLSCQVYQGAAFWDQETYNLPMFAFTHPEIAKRLVAYRHDTLGGAKRKAESLGYYGAFYAWTSGKTGDELFPDFFFTDVLTGRKIRNHFNCWQIHISPDVVYGIWMYYQATGDWSFMREQGAEVLFEVAQFLVSRVHFKKDKNRYEIIRVLGPDEYHENVDNNAYTNYLSAFALHKACEVFDRLSQSDPGILKGLLEKIGVGPEARAEWKEIADLLFLPQPDPESGVIEQFDGYLKLEDIRPDALRKRLIHPEEYWGWPNGIAVLTQVLKQADVIQLLAMLDGFSDEVLTANYEFYEPRTEHGSSLSPSVHALVASRAGHAEEAYRYFLESATIDLYNASKKVMSGGSFLGGIHTAAAGGVWLIAIKGFAGLEVHDKGIRFQPALPKSWEAMEFTLNIRGCLLDIRITHKTLHIESHEDNPERLRVEIAESKSMLEPGKGWTTEVA